MIAVLHIVYLLHRLSFYLELVDVASFSAFDEVVSMPYWHSLDLATKTDMGRY